jgi:hypothetical protein
MMEYEKILPILLRHKAHPGKALIQELCDVEGVWKFKGSLWGETVYKVQWPEDKFHMDYAGYHYVPLNVALQADKVSVVQYAGTSELTVVLEYFNSNPITEKFKKEQLLDQYEMYIVLQSKDPALLVGQLKTNRGIIALENKLKGVLL